ncbi:MAG: sigma-54 dependent transcriptional regulator [Nitrospirota bacterium]
MNTAKKKVLIVDDDKNLRSVVRDVLSDEGFSVAEAPDGVSALKIFKKDLPDAVLLDLNMPHMGGLETLQELKKINSHVPVIILTAYSDIPTVVEAVKRGAYDFTVKPPDFDRLIITVKRAVERRDLEMEVRRATTALELSLEQVFGRSDAMKTVINQIRQVAQTEFSVIIQGETGTGKSFVANTIHNMSRRADKSFVRVDIGLIPDTLVESELFGYRKGAFTGAEKNKIGYFETAGCGTIFIDELENMSPYVQSKLLSVIERKKVYPLGSTESVAVDVRVIAATNKDIQRSMRAGDFRDDLFYRLGEFIINLPPLRQRAEDIPFFAQKFLLDACTELNKQIKGMHDSAVELLLQHTWPGNIRELKNVIRRAVLSAESDVIQQEHIELLIKNHHTEVPASPLSLKDEIRMLEKRRIREALAKTGGNKTKAAELLRISYTNICEKIKEYGIG